jgi:hypothetical protein
MSQYQAAMNQPAGRTAWQERTCRRREATGSWSSRVEVRPTNATGTGSPGPARVSPALRLGLGVVLAMPLQYLHDCPGLPRVYFFRAFPGDA